MIRAAGLLLVLTVLGSVPGNGQQLGPSTGGFQAVDQGLRFLGHHKRILMIGAHPDDEDTEFLTVAVRGLGAEAAYLALTRGEGGQNLIGPELGDGLGILRTEELLGARRLDGAGQFFSRAFDFGYSKGLPDTWSRWPPDSILKDVVRVIRSYRPQIIVSVFSGTPRDGHGQHQAAGRAAHEAFEAAGDSRRFPELVTEEGLPPWTPQKLYQGARFSPEAATLTLDGGVLDPAVGQTFLQIAMRGRSLHRSQDMGQLQPIGPSAVRVTLVKDRTGAGAEGLFQGIDTTLGSMVAAGQSAEARRIGERLGRLRSWDLTGLAALRGEFATLVGPTPPVAARDQLRRMDQVLLAASGVLCDALTETARLLPGTSVPVTLSCWNTTTSPVAVTGSLRVLGQEGVIPWRATLVPGSLGSATIVVAISASAPPSTPYFLALEKTDGMALYQWPARIHSVPFETAPLEAGFAVGEAGAVWREVEFRYNDQAIGEVRRPVVVAPALSVELSPATGLAADGKRQARVFQVTLHLLSANPLSGRVWLEVPRGWTTDSARPFALEPSRAEQRITLTATIPSGLPSGRYPIGAVAEDAAGGRYRLRVATVEYPHTRPRQWTAPATAELVLAPLRMDGVGRVGYIRGAADQIPEVLRTLGLDLTLLGADSLARGELSRFDVIVVGPRAYETEPALADWSGRLETFVRAGGTVLVQYQQQSYFRGGFAPFALSLTDRLDGPVPARVSAPRVAEENALVRLLSPGHPVFHQPNQLDATDWDGWIQERGLYFARAWAAEWEPLLEMADTGEDQLQGALLVSRVGRGLYLYTGLSFFRQLPAGVPGATRLLLNLLALRP